MQPEESHVASLPGHGGRARFRAQRPLVEEEDQPPFQRQHPDKALGVYSYELMESWFTDMAKEDWMYKSYFSWNISGSAILNL